MLKNVRKSHMFFLQPYVWSVQLKIRRLVNLTKKEDAMVRQLAYEQKKSASAIMTQALREFYIKHKEGELCSKQSSQSF